MNLGGGVFCRGVLVIVYSSYRQQHTVDRTIFFFFFLPYHDDPLISGHGVWVERQELLARPQSGSASLPSDGITARSNPTHTQINKHKKVWCVFGFPQALALQKTQGLGRDRVVTESDTQSIKHFVFFYFFFYMCVYSKWLFDEKSPSVLDFILLSPPLYSSPSCLKACSWKVYKRPCVLHFGITFRKETVLCRFSAKW